MIKIRCANFAARIRSHSQISRKTADLHYITVILQVFLFGMIRRPRYNADRYIHFIGHTKYLLTIFFSAKLFNSEETICLKIKSFLSVLWFLWGGGTEKQGESKFQSKLICCVLHFAVNYSKLCRTDYFCRTTLFSALFESVNW